MSPERPLVDLIKLLSSALGQQKANDTISTSAKALGVRGGGISRAQALTILETLASEPGLTGVAARFAKSHVLLTWRE